MKAERITAIRIKLDPDIEFEYQYPRQDVGEGGTLILFGPAGEIAEVAEEILNALER